MTHEANPFATRFTRPGRLAAVDVDGRPIDLDAVLERLDRIGGRGAILGPHGSGKSTLLAHLREATTARGRTVRDVRLRSWRDAPAAVAAVTRVPRGGLVCLDGWECLGPVAHWVIRTWAWLRGSRLVVTCHRVTWLPVLVRCRPSPAVLEALVRQLPGSAEWLGDSLTTADIRAAFDRHGGDLREALFDLYDRMEERRRPTADGRT